MFEALKGKKTYLVAAAGAVVTGLYFAGIIDAKLAEILLGFLGFTGLATLRAGVDNSKGGI